MPKLESFPHIENRAEHCEPLFRGSSDDFLRVHTGSLNLHRQLKNKVKKCTCGKPNAFTLSNCNACGSALTELPVSYTDNVFTAFIYGIERGPYPFSISIRNQNENFLIFDDLLTVSSCHLNTIPTTRYIPDWRYLLKRPKEGLAILQEMRSLCISVVREQFLANEAFRSSLINPMSNISDDELIELAVCGFNYPPSQYQLHLQFILLPYLPFQFQLYCAGIHYSRNRWFPYTYVEQVLKLNEVYNFDENTPIESLISHFQTRGIDYHSIYTRLYQQLTTTQQRVANFSADKFHGFVCNGKVYRFTNGDPTASADVLHYTLSPLENAKDTATEDKKLLQNYGRPYCNNTPTTTYYKFAKPGPSNVEVW
ncbi:hypothetical protein Pelo_3711 [Pelomyxa schiedti]|nr:hypothetical protein Pelo_3711 [Pelomyxa schiedti]